MAAPTYDPNDSGLLLVFSDPGSEATLAEFHDWYDNEHVPLRTKAFASFTSAARYRVASSVAASSTAAASPVFAAEWGALYSISTNATFADPRYTSLRTQRSPREAELLARVATLDRRIYRCVYDSAAAQPRDTSASGAPAPVRAAPLAAAEASPCVVCTSVTPADGCKAEYDTWYVEEHAPLLAKVPGWRRSRRYELVDALIVGKQARPANADGAEVPFCLALNEWDSPAFQETAEFKHLMNTPWRNKVNDPSRIVRRERRVMELYRAWECEAAVAAAEQ